tara:strand:- start:16091 stop:16438 length:348 start_codon:yes stop_codon:yes gene_type:complete
MSDLRIISETPMNMYELKEELEKIKKKEKELDFRENKTEDYLNQTAAQKNAKQLFDKLMDLGVPRLKEQQIHKIIDILPTTVKDLQVVLQGYVSTINKDGQKKIVDAINDFLSKS